MSQNTKIAYLLCLIIGGLIGASGFWLPIIVCVLVIITGLLAIFIIYRSLTNENVLNKSSRLFFCLIIMIVASFASNGVKSNQNKKMAEQLITALEKYNTIHHQYPHQLEDLTPLYLDKAPTYYGTWWRTENFNYRSTKGEFELGYSPDDFVLNIYQSNSKQWTVDSGIT